MKFAVASEHRDYFQKNKYIEFEGLLNAEQLMLLKEGIDAAIGKHLHLPVAKLNRLTSERKFMAGRDPWRLDDHVKKIVTSSQLADIASELIEKKPLRLGYVQYYPKTPSHDNVITKTAYDGLLAKESSLEDVSCLQGVLCGLMISLSDGPIDAENNTSVFPSKAGNGIFIQPSHIINFTELRKKNDQEFLLIVYSEKNAVYIMREGDPQVHALKMLGYVFGDKLSDKLNPILCR